MTARILIVDDVPANARLLSARLEQEYYQVRTAGDGFGALGAVRSWAPDLVLLDVMMPGMDGFETCRRLKADERTSHVPVVMVTALSEPEERVRGLDAGADDFLTKPVEYETLLARVRGLVRLKRLSDEWRLRAETVRDLGLANGHQVAPTIVGRRVLVVDDRKPWAQAARDCLALEGLLPSIAGTEAEALAMLAAAQFELIVLSLSMSVDDPLRLLSHLRAAPGTAELPLLLVAEQDERERLLRGFDIGASDWLTRPVDVNELRVRARNQIRRKLYQDQLRADLGEALRLALVDPMTGLHNRRYLMHHLAGLMGPQAAPGLTVLMLDVDHFKTVNDRWGHRAGDDALRFIAGLLRQHVRAFDSLARYGGEEFVVVMPGATEEDGRSAAERLREAVEAHEFRPDGTTLHKLTISVGLSRNTDTDTTPEALLNAADDALYAAKRAGRNRTQMAGDAT